MAASIRKCQRHFYVSLKRLTRLFSTTNNVKINSKLDRDDSKTTHFGFETVTEKEKEEKGL